MAKPSFGIGAGTPLGTLQTLLEHDPTRQSVWFTHDCPGSFPQ